MNDRNSEGKAGGNCCSPIIPSTCCQPVQGGSSTCCNPENPSWRKGKLIISAIIIAAAIAVGANSFFNGNAASYTTMPAKSFSAGLSGIPAVTSDNRNTQTKAEEVALNRVLDSLQSLDTLAADKDVVFLVLSADLKPPAPEVPKQLGTVAKNLANAGQKIGVFTIKTGAPDYDRLVRHFSVNAFPSVVILSRQGSASAVSGDITEARLYNAFVLASQSASCCPGQGSASCCPPQSNTASSPK